MKRRIRDASKKKLLIVAAVTLSVGAISGSDVLWSVMLQIIRFF